MNTIDFPIRPFPLLVIAHTRNSSFSMEMRSKAQFPAIAFEPDLVSVLLQGIAQEDDATEEIALVMDRLLKELDVCLSESGRRVFAYDLEAKDGRVDLFVLIDECLRKEGQPTNP